MQNLISLVRLNGHTICVHICDMCMYTGMVYNLHHHDIFICVCIQTEFHHHSVHQMILWENKRFRWICKHTSSRYEILFFTHTFILQYLWIFNFHRSKRMTDNNKQRNACPLGKRCTIFASLFFCMHWFHWNYPSTTNIISNIYKIKSTKRINEHLDVRDNALNWINEFPREFRMVFSRNHPLLSL